MKSYISVWLLCINTKATHPLGDGLCDDSKATMSQEGVVRHPAPEVDTSRLDVNKLRVGPTSNDGTGCAGRTRYTGVVIHRTVNTQAVDRDKCRWGTKRAPDWSMSPIIA